MAYYKQWRGKEISDAVKKNMAKALGEFGLIAEGHAKRQLQKGHGVLTGTLRRSIHTAPPGYNWAGDSGRIEEGGQVIEAVVEGKRITLLLGSGLGYALPVHQGHHSFEGYHFLANGIEQARQEMPGVLMKYELK